MNSIKTKFFAIVLATALMGLVALPESVKENWPDVMPVSWFKELPVKLNLDLQGGVRLDYKIDLTQAIADGVDIPQLVEGTRKVIENRVDALGVAEPRITIATIGDEQHVIVELAGLQDVQAAKDLIGKPVNIEFKQQKLEADDSEIEEKRAYAQVVLEEVLEEGADFQEVGEEQQTSSQGKSFFVQQQYFQDELLEEEAFLWDLEPNTIHNEIVEGTIQLPFNNQLETFEKLTLYKTGEKEVVSREKTEPGEAFDVIAQEVSITPETIDVFYTENTIPQNILESVDGLSAGEISEKIETETAIEIYKLLDKRFEGEAVNADQILVQYAGSEYGSDDVTRTKEEAQVLAQEAYAKVIAEGSDFTALVDEYSDHTPSKSKGGNMGYVKRGTMPDAINDKLFNSEAGTISEVIESPRGFHILRINEYREEGTKYDLQKIALAKDTENVDEVIAEIKDRITDKEVTVDEEQLTLQSIVVPLIPEQWESTGLGSQQFEGAEIVFDQFNQVSLSITFNGEGADMFDELTQNNIQKPIAIFVGGELVSAPVVQQRISSGVASISGNFTYQEVAELKTLLDAGTFPAPLIIKEEGKISSTLGKESLQQSITAGLFGLLILAVYMLIYYRLAGLIANVSLFIYAIMIVFILKISPVLGMPILLSLAGVAGFILSIGMAVDANVLIFERLKEELSEGNNLRKATQIAFERAWTSIRDSNISTLLTCFILAIFGSSIIRGFAITLGIGVVLSMFTAITITKTFMLLVVGDGQKNIPLWLFGGKKNKEK